MRRFRAICWTVTCYSLGAAAILAALVLFPLPTLVVLFLALGVACVLSFDREALRQANASGTDRDSFPSAPRPDATDSDERPARGVLVSSAQRGGEA